MNWIPGHWVREMELDPNLRVVRNATGIGDAFQTDHVYIMKENSWLLTVISFRFIHSIHHTSRRGGVYSIICTRIRRLAHSHSRYCPKNILLGDHNEKLQKVHHCTSF